MVSDLGFLGQELIMRLEHHYIARENDLEDLRE